MKHSLPLLYIACFFMLSPCIADAQRTPGSQMVTTTTIIQKGEVVRTKQVVKQDNFYSSRNQYVNRSYSVPAGLLLRGNGLIIPSDSDTHSVLLSDLLADNSGFESPIIGAGAWSDPGKYIQARSLLFFELKDYTAGLKASDIDKAELILFPLKMNDSEEFTTYPKIAVRRVIKPWEDSSATWNNQPEVSLSDEVNYTLGPLKKIDYYKINVTKLFRNMLRFGNYGFQITFPDNNETMVPFSRWFASPKNEEASLRPFLLITVYDGVLDYYRSPFDLRQTPMNFNDAVRSMPGNDMNWFSNGKADVQPVPVIPSSPPPPPPPKKDDN